MVIHGGIFKNNQITIFPFSTFILKTGVSFYSTIAHFSLKMKTSYCIFFNPSSSVRFAYFCLDNTTDWSSPFRTCSQCIVYVTSKKTSLKPQSSYDCVEPWGPFSAYFLGPFHVSKRNMRLICPEGSIIQI